MRRLCGLLLILFVASGLHAQDIRINCGTQPTCVLTPQGGQQWANGNQVWVFTPLDPRASIYIFVHNNNTTSAHTSQAVTVFTTPFVQSTAPSLSLQSSKWNQNTLQQNTVAGASCNNVNANANTASPGANGQGSCYVVTTFAAQVAIRITGAASASGSPDTFDLSIVQGMATPGGLNPGANAASSVPVDPCPDPTVPKTAIALALSGTSQLTTGQPLQSIYVCGFSFTMAAVVQSVQFAYATSNNMCNAAVDQRTGPYASDATGVVYVSFSGMEILGGPTGGGPSNVGKALCALVTGMAPSINGTIVVVQK